MRLFANADYPFIEWRRRAFLISGVAMLIGIGAMVYNVASIGSWLNYGVDFSGGTLVQVRFDETTTIDEIRGLNPEWQISRFGDESEFVIRMPTYEQDLGQDISQRVVGLLATRFDRDAFEIVRTEAVGPTVGAELQQKALIAILISFVATLIYLAFRFEWRFGVAAVIATAHDIVITLGVVALLQSEISAGTVAAFLTIVGYSLNDTIIVFDRIRENLAKRIRGRSFVEIVDRSINETLPRTVLTAVTTLATLTALFLFGGAVIRDFALVLILGIGIGTFSSIFVASPALFVIESKWPPEEKKTRKRPSRGREKAVV
ncbi:MAG TPA: protein translocase subunit SecF [Longimicrobiaceae bacterium]|nr:protein translocase subunit SecF [Longimicrobiaceae bacterium]